jgi:hypothetical protein
VPCQSWFDFDQPVASVLQSIREEQAFVTEILTAKIAQWRAVIREAGIQIER